jgi:hypothetical protein
MDLNIEKTGQKIKQVLDYFSAHGMKIYSREFLKKKLYLEDILSFCDIFGLSYKNLLSEDDLDESELIILIHIENICQSVVNALVCFRKEADLSLADLSKKLKAYNINMSRANLHLFESRQIFKINLEFLGALLRIYNKKLEDVFNVKES